MRNICKKIKYAIDSRNCQVVSFDMFDTLVTRPFFEPTDLFESIGGKNFCKARRKAELDAREKSPTGEVTLDDIYAALGDSSMKQKEISAELSCCQPRKAAKALFDYALCQGRRVIIVSDMYLSSEVLFRMLSNCGYAGWERLYVSSELKVTKHSTRLYRVIQREMELPARAFVHIGDNMSADVLHARLAGWRGMPFYRTINLLKKEKAFQDRYAGQKISLEEGKRLAMLANEIFDNPDDRMRGRNHI